MSDRRAAPANSLKTAAKAGPVRIGLVGATGMIGRRAIEISSAGDSVRMVGIARREVDLPAGARMEMFVANPDKWSEVLEAVKPRALICALGTTWKKAGRDEAAFRAVDQDLVVQTAKAAHAAGVPNLVLISAAGANAQAKSLYMRVKGETEQMVSQIGFKRLDVLRPGLLRGSREGEFRPLERAAMAISPLIDPLLSGSWEMYRSIEADLVVEAALGLALRRAAGRFTHDNDAMRRAAREWRRTNETDED